MERVARLMAIGMVLVAASTVMMGTLAGQANASEPVDGPRTHDEQRTYRKVKEFWSTHDNDVYMKLLDQRKPRVVELMKLAADDACKGTLFEDFSCRERAGIRAADVLRNPTDANCEAWQRWHYDGR